MQVSDRFEEVKLSVKVVNGLKELNSKKRDDDAKDKTFIKALLVGLFGVKNIKSGQVDKRIVRFIKGKSNLDSHSN